MSEKSNIDEAWLRQKIEIEDFSFAEVGRILGENRKKISRLCDKLGIKKQEKLYMNKKWLSEKVLVENLSTTEIGNLCDVDGGTINIWVKKFKIEKPNPCKDREWLYDQYIAQRKSTAQIGQEIGMKKGTVWNWVKKHEIDINEIKNHSYRDLDWVYQQYIINDRTMTDMAEECGIVIETMSFWVTLFELEKAEMKHFCYWCQKECYPDAVQQQQSYFCCSRKCRSDLMRVLPSNWYKDAYFHNRDWLYQKYHLEGLSQQQIADECGIMRKTVNRMLKYFDLEKETVNTENVDNYDWLYDQYIEQNKTRDQIAQEQGLSIVTIGRRLHQFELFKLNFDYVDFSYRDEKWLRNKIEVEKTIPYHLASECNLNSSGPIYKYMARYNISVPVLEITELDDDEWLREEYIRKNKSIATIAMELNSNFNKVRTQLFSFGIKKKAADVTDFSYKIKEWLEHKVVEEKLSTEEIAEICGLKSSSAVNYYINVFGIERPKQPLEDADWLFEQYITKNRLAQDIANELGYVASTVVSWASYHGIRKQGRIEPNTYRDRDYLIQCAADGLTLRDVAESEGIGWDSVHYYAEKYEIVKLFKRETDIERIMRLELEQLNEDFEAQYRIAQFTTDFYLPKYRIVVECDGTYWHSQPDTIEKDKRRDKYMEGIGLKVLRFPDYEIHEDIKGCIMKIKEEIMKVIKNPEVTGTRF